MTQHFVLCLIFIRLKKGTRIYLEIESGERVGLTRPRCVERARGQVTTALRERERERAKERARPASARRPAPAIQAHFERGLHSWSRQREREETKFISPRTPPKTNLLRFHSSCFVKRILKRKRVALRNNEVLFGTY